MDNNYLEIGEKRAKDVAIKWGILSTLISIGVLGAISFSIGVYWTVIGLIQSDVIGVLGFLVILMSIFLISVLIEICGYIEYDELFTTLRE